MNDVTSWVSEERLNFKDATYKKKNHILARQGQDDAKKGMVVLLKMYKKTNGFVRGSMCSKNHGQSFWKFGPAAAFNYVIRPSADSSDALFLGRIVSDIQNFFKNTTYIGIMFSVKLMYGKTWSDVVLVIILFII